MPSKSRSKIQHAIDAACIPTKLGGNVGGSRVEATGRQRPTAQPSRRREVDEDSSNSTLPPSRYDEDRVRDTEAQIRRIDALLDEVGSKDVQGVARLVSTRRGLVEDLHAELLRRQEVDTGGDSSSLEGTLAEALAEMDLDSVRRVLEAAAARAGLELQAWVTSAVH